MKVSFLMMPFSVIVSIIIIIWHIYPAWLGDGVDSIKKIREENNSLQKEIDDIQSKKSNVSKLGVFLDSDDELKNLAQNYYSTSRNDEDIINSINNIAFNEGIYLDDMDLKYQKIKDSQSPIQIMSLKNVEEIKIPLPEAPVTTVVTDKSEPVAPASRSALNSKINYIEVSLKATGNYDQTKGFLISLNNIGLLNKIQSFDIKKSKKTQTENSENTNSNEDMLETSIVIGFGYYDESKEKEEKLLYSEVLEKTSFNFSGIEGKEDILRGIYYKTEVSETGLPNPFIKNED
ncbi:MAG: hypothetical protein V3574_04100 [Candidatus Moraniibacteriota bacterium]